MSNKRIELIIKEIIYWKKHKLLSEEYCDFLLALYTNGENEKQSTADNIANRNKLSPFLQLSIAIIMLILSILVVYNQHVQPLFQPLLLFALLFFCFWLYIKLRENNDTISKLALISLLIMFLNVSLYFTKLLFHYSWLINGVVLLNFLIWLLISYKIQLQYLRFISLALVLITIGYVGWELLAA